jgi:hypothetical protein
MRLYLKKTLHKKGLAGGVAQDEGPEFKTQHCQKKKKSQISSHYSGLLKTERQAII